MEIIDIPLHTSHLFVMCGGAGEFLSEPLSLPRELRFKDKLAKGVAC